MANNILGTMPFILVTDLIDTTVGLAPDMVTFDLLNMARRIATQTILIIPKKLFDKPIFSGKLDWMNTITLFVVIDTTSFTAERTAEVPDSMVVNENTGQKEHVTDNVAPNPRRWTLSGYIAFDQSMYTLGVRALDAAWKIFAREYMSETVNNIDNAMLIREPVKIKTPEGRVYTVFIDSFSYSILDNANNAFSVQLSFTEFIEYTASIKDITLPGQNIMTTAVKVSK